MCFMTQAIDYMCWLLALHPLSNLTPGGNKVSKLYLKTLLESNIQEHFKGRVHVWTGNPLVALPSVGIFGDESQVQRTLYLTAVSNDILVPPQVRLSDLLPYRVLSRALGYHPQLSLSQGLSGSGVPCSRPLSLSLFYNTGPVGRTGKGINPYPPVQSST